LLESISSEVPQLSVPLRAFDQPFNCEYVQLLGVGQCVYSDNVEDIKRSIAKIEENNFL